MAFYSELNKPPVEPTPSGSKKIDKYELKIVDNKKQLVKVGKTNIYDIKQEALESTKIYNILKRHAMGDDTALNLTKGQFMDVTQMPKDLLEAENAILKTKREFEKLDIEERKKYNQNWREWLNDIIIKQQTAKEQETKKSYIDTITPVQNQSLQSNTNLVENGGKE